MVQDLPNAAFVVSYVGAPWTLGVDATAQLELISRLLTQMEKEDAGVAVPGLGREDWRNIKMMPMLRLTSTDVQKGKDVLPMTGDGTK